MTDWRIFLYPAGFLANLMFGLRFLFQWIQSEKAHKSVASKAFWNLSLIGNILLLLHTIVQSQIHIALLQGLSAVISWRNLNLLQTKRQPVSFKCVIFLFAAVIFFICSLFLAATYGFNDPISWFRVPLAPWQSSEEHPVSITWHLIGTIGYGLFSGRFWIQWWYAERAQTSMFPVIFWQMSLAGALLSMTYFYYIGDMVNLIGPVFGLFPYIRNLMLLKENLNQESP